jgi:hypothetical protein
MKQAVVTVLSAALLIAFAAVGSASAEVKLTVADKQPPAELPADVKGQLAPKSYTIADDKGTVYEFWFVPGLKGKTVGATMKETLLGVEEVGLLGAVVVSDAEPHDFRDDPIDKGLFVLRMALQPKDGNHLGTAPYDTFAIMVPAEKDGRIKDAHNHDGMVEVAKEGTIAKHPPILSLQPIEGATGDFPRIEENTEHEWQFLYLKLPLDVAGKKADLVVGLVVEGHGEI